MAASTGLTWNYCHLHSMIVANATLLLDVHVNSTKHAGVRRKIFAPFSKLVAPDGMQFFAHCHPCGPWCLSHVAWRNRKLGVVHPEHRSMGQFHMAGGGGLPTPPRLEGGGAFTGGGGLLGWGGMAYLSTVYFDMCPVPSQSFCSPMTHV